MREIDPNATALKAYDMLSAMVELTTGERGLGRIIELRDEYRRKFGRTPSRLVLPTFRLLGMRVELADAAEAFVCEDAPLPTLPK